MESSARSIIVLGAGWVGLISAVTLVEAGFSVVLVEKSVERVRELRAGVCAIGEPRLQEALQAALASGRLSIFALEDEELGVRMKAAVLGLICVNTPMGEEGKTDLRDVETAADWLAAHLPKDGVLVVKSTVPPGTCRALAARTGKAVLSNAEYLAESTGLRDARMPQRFVVGADEPAGEMQALIDWYIAPWRERGVAIVLTDTISAEMAKLAANAFLPVKVSYANELANIAEAVGADPEQVLKIVGMDDRIGSKFLQYGLGWGGGCFPKDTASLRVVAESVGAPAQMLQAAIAVNDRQIAVYADKVRAVCGGTLGGKRVTILGLAFKPNTNDARVSPALRLIDALLAEGTELLAYDPGLKRSLAPRYPAIYFADTLDEALSAPADARVLATAWPDITAALKKIPPELWKTIVNARP